MKFKAIFFDNNSIDIFELLDPKASLSAYAKANIPGIPDLDKMEVLRKDGKQLYDQLCEIKENIKENIHDSVIEAFKKTCNNKAPVCVFHLDDSLSKIVSIQFPGCILTEEHDINVLIRDLKRNLVIFNSHSGLPSIIIRQHDKAYELLAEFSILPRNENIDYSLSPGNIKLRIIDSLKEFIFKLEEFKQVQNEVTAAEEKPLEEARQLFFHQLKVIDNDIQRAKCTQPYPKMYSKLEKERDNWLNLLCRFELSAQASPTETEVEQRKQWYLAEFAKQPGRQTIAIEPSAVPSVIAPSSAFYTPAGSASAENQEIDHTVTPAAAPAVIDASAVTQPPSELRL